MPNNGSTDRTRVSESTRDAQRRDADLSAAPDRMPTPEEERAAEKHSVDPNVAASAKEATERGANQRGEGRIEA